MKVRCKNTGCKHYYKANGRHCPAEETCEHYTWNEAKSDERIKCKDCVHCKRIYTNGGQEYHYECFHNGSRKRIFFVEEGRMCDVRNE